MLIEMVDKIGRKIFGDIGIEPDIRILERFKKEQINKMINDAYLNFQKASEEIQMVSKIKIETLEKEKENLDILGKLKKRREIQKENICCLKQGNALLKSKNYFLKSLLNLKEAKILENKSVRELFK